MQNSDGIIVVLSYPDTIVRPAYWEILSGFWSKIGIGSKHSVQAGHAALLLIKKNEPTIQYFDFGRYITTYGNGRVRSEKTDVELHVPLKAVFKENELYNLEEILLWIEKHPEKTHGEGRLIATVNNEINYNKAQSFITDFIAKKEIPYGTFLKNASNCARFVTDTIITATTNLKIKKSLKQSNYLTPSPIGNVIKATSTNKIYKVYQQKITPYLNRSILKEYKATFFKKFNHELNVIGTEEPNISQFELDSATWLGGIGSGAWFHVEEQLDHTIFKIARYTPSGKKDFEGSFTVDKEGLDPEIPYSFDYPTNCLEMYIKQNNTTYYLKNLKH
ncbi:DUF6695 family protein [uncultured Polaribacter sp.]|uniref:DUF6695 family protein n=1 Tax=uncultured Polaribacter sp. TaxID=174711 RepID=UPI002604A0C4|nr:DUF6695 family protein [uncultured Polaribacter sp.]